MSTKEEYEPFWGEVERLSDDGSGVYMDSCKQFSLFAELIDDYNRLKAESRLPRYPKASGAGYSIRFSNDLSMCSIILELDKIRTTESKCRILDLISLFMEQNVSLD